MVILSVLPLLFWAVLWCYWLISAFRAKKSVLNKSWWLRTIGIRLAILVIVIFVIADGHTGIMGRISADWAFVVPGPGSILFGVIGVILSAAGIAFAVWARVYLGRNWGMPMSLREKPELVTSGPYKFVRHPIYSGFLIAMLGTALVDGIYWLLIFVIAGIYFIYSAKMEEKMMLGEFPDQYPDYRKSTKMLIPFIL